MNVRLVVTGRMYHLAEEAPDSLTLDDGARLDDALAALQQLLAEPLPPSCLIAVGGDHLGTVAGHENRELRDGDELVFLSPVAGG